MKFLSLALILPVAAHKAEYVHKTMLGSKEGSVMNLQMLNSTSSTGAVCLDGTPAGFYFAPASDPKNANDWQIYFQGGGWCYDEEDCWGRSKTNLGSSKNWAPTSEMGGIMSDDCASNPDFCNFNRVHMARERFRNIIFYFTFFQWNLDVFWSLAMQLYAVAKCSF